MWTSFHPRRFSAISDPDTEGQTDVTEQQHGQSRDSYVRRPSSSSKASVLRNGAVDGSVGATRHTGLWPLQITPNVEHQGTRQISSAEQSSSSRGSTSSFPTSKYSTPHVRIGDVITHDPSSSSFSPPSPFEINNSDSSPPMTPPDSLSVASQQVGRSWSAGLSPQASLGSETLEAHLRRTSVSEQKGPESSDSTPQAQYESAFSNLSVPKSSSRNSIFSASSPVMVPAPRLPPVTDRIPKTRELSSHGSSNGSSIRQADFYFDMSTSSNAPSSWAPPTPALRRTSIASSLDENDRPGYGRSNTEEREREREKIRQTNMDVDFRLYPTKDYLLGEGRHSDVYLGSYRVRKRSQHGSDRSDACTEPQSWTLCAMKRPHADHQSQLLALEEAFALRRLGPHPNIIRLIKIRDEVELSTPPQDKYQSYDSYLGKGLPTEPSSTTSPASHSRSASDTHTIDRGATVLDRVTGNPAFHRRLVSQPEGQKNGETAKDGEAQNEPPRLLMLLELLPFSLSTFVRRNVELVDFEQWRCWALELAGVIEWMHARGCIHADLKPENVLLTSDLHVKICDFNSALFPNPSTPLMDGMGLGTPAFGAPELSRGTQHRGGKVKGFSFPVDIWSLGVILYSLATGVEPFRRARSMIDIVYRKRVFFESEESDRIARMSVAEGSSTAGAHSRLSFAPANSLPASRSGSLRGRKGDLSTSTAASPHSIRHHRAPSSESVSSVASSAILSSTAGRHPSVQAINLLLDEETPIGLLASHGASSQQVLRVSTNKGENTSPTKKILRLSNAQSAVNGHHRASSLGKMQTSQYRASQSKKDEQNDVRRGEGQEDTKEPAAHPPQALSVRAIRPDSIRRATSYTGKPTMHGASETDGDTSHEQHRPEQAMSIHERESVQRNTKEIRMAVAAAIANSSARKVGEEGVYQSDSDPFSTFDGSSTAETESNLTDDIRAYSDGSPALILPGGGRLPDEARTLLKRMLNVDPDVRPNAAQVRATLEAL